MKYVFGAIILLLVGTCVYLEITKSYLASDLNDAQQSVVALTISNKNFQSSVEAANKAMEAEKLEADTRAALADKAVTEAQKQAEAYNKSAQSIMTSKPADSDDCKATSVLVNSYIARLK